MMFSLRVLVRRHIYRLSAARLTGRLAPSSTTWSISPRLLSIHGIGRSSQARCTPEALNGAVSSANRLPPSTGASRENDGYDGWWRYRRTRDSSSMLVTVPLLSVGLVLCAGSRDGQGELGSSILHANTALIWYCLHTCFAACTMCPTTFIGISTHIPPDPISLWFPYPLATL